MSRNTNGKGYSLKDILFNEEQVTYLGTLFHKTNSSFNIERFVDNVMRKFPDLELKQRIVCIAEALEEELPKDFERSVKIILKALPEPLDPTKKDDDFGNFIFAPLGEYVVRNGLSREHLEISLDTLEEITKRFSMEDAIRYFLNTFEKETMMKLAIWAKSKNYHVRRLASEGTRPLLPWSGRIGLSIEEVVPLLDELYFDTTRYVTRSVANHMNDISKKNPKLAVATLQRWKKEGEQTAKEMDWIISHSLRTLVKQGDKDALKMLGYHHDPAIAVERYSLKESSKNIALGETLEFSFDIKAKNDEKLMIDYVIDFVKANGKTTPKVFKIKKLSVLAGQTYTVAKKHRFPESVTTFTYYPGEHTITLQINGKQFGSKTFILS